MMRRFVVALGLTTLACILTVQAADPLPVPKGKDKEPSSLQEEVRAKQALLADRFFKFEQELLALAQRLERSSKQEDREKAQILKDAIKLANESGVDVRFGKLIDVLQKSKANNLQEVKEAIDQAELLSANLRSILALLLSDSRDAQLKAEKDRIQNILKELNKVIREQKVVRAQVERGGMDPEQLAKNQDNVTGQTKNVANAMGSKNDGKPGDGKGAEAKKGETRGEGKPGNGKGESKEDTRSPKGESRPADGNKSGDNKSGDNKGGDPKSGEAKPGDGKGGDPKSGEAKPGDGKGGDPKSGEAKPGDGKGGDPKSGEAKPGDGKGGDPKSGEAKPGDGKGGDPKSGDPKSGSSAKGGDPKAGDGKAGGSKGGDPKSGEAKPGDGKPGDGKSGQGQGKSQSQGKGQAKAGQGQGKGEAKSSDGKSGQPSQGGKSGQGQAKSGGQQSGQQQGGSPQAQPQQPQQPKTPGRQQVEDAIAKQQKALDDIRKKDNPQASGNQDQAIKDLEAARKQLEEILRQLREEEIERLLAQLQARCEYMLQMQKEVYEGTVRVDRTIGTNPDKKPTRPDEQKAQQLGDREGLIVLEAGRAKNLIEAEGSAVAFAEQFTQIIDDMKNVQKRLNKTDIGLFTQKVELDIIATLEEMIDALKKAQKDMKQKQQSGQPSDGQPGKQPLIDILAELKMIRAMQVRINKRTEDYGKLYPGEVPDDGDLQREVRGLGERQDKVKKISEDIAKGRNR